MLKLFVDKDAQQTIAINPSLVKFVRETPIGTKVLFNDSSYVLIDEPFLEVIARLNERSK